MSASQHRRSVMDCTQLGNMAEEHGVHLSSASRTERHDYVWGKDHIRKPVLFWDHIWSLWTDETKINVFQSDGNGERRGLMKILKTAYPP